MEKVDEEMKCKGMALCKEYVGGSWVTVREEEFQINYIRYSTI